jgi:hypothetical protein
MFCQRFELRLRRGDPVTATLNATPLPTWLPVVVLPR